MVNVFLIFLILHFLGDYYFQTNRIANNKYKIKYLTIHVSLYFCSLCFSLAIFKSWALVLPLIVLNSLLHFGIDYLKENIQRRVDNMHNIKNPNGISLIMYFTDQFIHILCLFITSVIIFSFYKNESDLYYDYFLKIRLFNRIQIFDLIKMLLSLILILDPASITIQKIINCCNASKNDNDLKYFFSGISYANGKFKVNAEILVGFLERVFGLILCILGFPRLIFILFLIKWTLTLKQHIKQFDISISTLGSFLSIIFIIIGYLIIYN